MKNKEKSFFKEGWQRSLVKALTYRLVIIILDVCVIYLLTRKIEIAFWFMVVSNIYTTIAYYVHERLWNMIGWGRKPKHTWSA